MSVFIHLQTISDLYRFFNLGTHIQHPLVAVLDFSKVNEHIVDETKVSADFYSLIFKKYNRNNVKYGRKIVDFENGSLICMAPNQIIEMDNDEETSPELSGWGLFFHPDFIRTNPLHDKMKEYSFFSYEIAEALHSGKNAQEHIHFYLIEEAKNILLQTDKSVGEIAYALGFEYPQYFNKLFKQKTGKTPVEFRSLN